MTFGPQHYVPVLKIKRGEKKALQSISPTLQPGITPLLEIVERKNETIETHLDRAFRDLARSVEGYARCFIDAREISADGTAAAAEVFRRATSERIVFAPVTGISRTADVAAALGNRSHGIALRITRGNFERGGLGKFVESFLDRHGLAYEETDLIVDLGPVDDLIVEGVAALADAFLAEVPEQNKWRTLTLSASTFPISMGVVDRNSHSLLERAEWVTWRDRHFPRRAALPRLPSFGDCAIQHPRGVEGFDFRKMQVSASIRYTLPEAWLLIKGESTRKTRPGLQFPALATKLVYGYRQPYFAGQTHCIGCASMKAAADGAGGFGSAEAWRRLGTIHHLSTVVQKLNALPWT